MAEKKIPGRKSTWSPEDISLLMKSTDESMKVNSGSINTSDIRQKMGNIKTTTQIRDKLKALGKWSMQSDTGLLPAEPPIQDRKRKEVEDIEDVDDDDDDDDDDDTSEDDSAKSKASTPTKKKKVSGDYFDLEELPANIRPFRSYVTYKNVRSVMLYGPTLRFLRFKLLTGPISRNARITYSIQPPLHNDITAVMSGIDIEDIQPKADSEDFIFDFQEEVKIKEACRVSITPTTSSNELFDVVLFPLSRQKDTVDNYEI